MPVPYFQAELEEARATAANELAAVKEDAVVQVMAAEARGRRVSWLRID